MRLALALVAATALIPAAVTAAAGDSVRTTHSKYGRILVDGGGRTLYLFTKDGGRGSRCYGRCARAWPPYIVEGTPQAANGADAGLLGTIRRRGGTRQVTYDGHPVYYYVGDRQAGDILCQDVFEFGGRWLLVSPQGRAVQ